MFLCAVGLLALSLLQLVHGINFWGPAPTPTPTLPDAPRPDAPEPTSGADIRQWGIMRRDDDLVTSSYQADNVCGWVDANLGTASRVTCSPGLTCAHHASNSNWPGMIGCCQKLNCGFDKTCYGDAEASKLGKTSDYFTKLCTILGAAECITYNYGDLNARHYACGRTSTIKDMYTFAIGAASSGAATVQYDHSLSTVGDAVVSSYVSRFSSPPHSQSGDPTTTSNSASSSSEPSMAPPTPEPSSPPLETATPNSSTPAGAIAGGVVGGVAGGAAIALAGVFIYRRRKRRNQRNQPEVGGGSEYGSGGPQSMSGSQPSYLTVGMQSPSEMESRPSSYQIPPPQHTASTNMAHEMQGDTHHVVEADSNYASHSKDNAAELPAESRDIARP